MKISMVISSLLKFNMSPASECPGLASEQGTPHSIYPVCGKITDNNCNGSQDTPQLCRSDRIRTWNPGPKGSQKGLDNYYVKLSN